MKNIHLHFIIIDLTLLKCLNKSFPEPLSTLCKESIIYQFICKTYMVDEYYFTAWNYIIYYG